MEGKKDGNSRPQRAGGRCEPAGEFRMTGPGVFRLNDGVGWDGGPVTGRIVSITEGLAGDRRPNQGGIAWKRP